MILSLNELDALCKKGARGAGYTWGLAEEAGRAARWLAERELDAVGSMADLFEAGLARDLSAALPKPEAEQSGQDQIWTGEGSLCALACGAAISDQADALEAGRIRLTDVIAPLLLVRFAGLAARRLGRPVTIRCDAAMAVTDWEKVSLTGSIKGHAEHVSIALGGRVEHETSRRNRAYVEANALKRVEIFAHRTYAPATEQSRLLGAGAGLSDND